MPQIIEIIGCENKVKYARVHVLLNTGEEGVVYVGGSVEVYHDPEYDQIKVFVKKP